MTNLQATTNRPAPRQTQIKKTRHYGNRNHHPRNIHKPARAVREYSAGGVVFRTTTKGVEFLLIEDLKGRWSVPKGHVEAGETLEQTALREIGEETGLKDTQIVEKLDKVHFFYRFEGRLIFMTTFIYLIEALNPDEPIVVEESEGIVGARWFSTTKAQQILEYKDLKNLMARSVDIIKEREAV